MDPRSSRLGVVFPFEEFGASSPDGEPPTPVGRVTWPAVMLTAAAWAWCPWLLLVCVVAPSWNKPSYPLQVPRSGAAVSPPAGRGGEGTRANSSSSCVRAEKLDGVGRLSAPEAAYQGVPKRRPMPVAATCGAWSHSLLGSPSFFLQAGVPSRRIFLDLTLGFMAGTAPSGLFPGGGGDPHACASNNCGGAAQGLDRVFGLLSRVSSVKVTASSFIPPFPRGLLVICNRNDE
jgi:hypothetical protein